ncbi:class I mannose-6-phosphate isomerase [Mucilaginibacter celer]|uniref:Mannose-6-phosphate isomerase n=1 Tax=Mucilaginibacter celer TaxID=2305508 RepID=A0A494W5L9_9SPHI|nr:class I mannose-6-phosphate isomerase [Mucilaginibacter celer]AYL99093.1 hypothetical protein HYN43_029165 [Mucilaginibacter celer]
MPPNPDFLDTATSLRNTEQFLMPAGQNGCKLPGYDIYPAFKTPETISRGYDGIVKYMLGVGTHFIFEGFGGVQWEMVKASVSGLLGDTNVNWINIDTCLKPEAEVNNQVAPFTGGDDPLFGTAYTGSLLDFFDQAKLSALAPPGNGLTIIYGCGAGLVNWQCPVIYFDVPKNEIQFRSRAGNVRCLGAGQPADAKVQYKRFYFVDWPVFNQHKKKLLGQVDIWVDEQRPDDITWISGQGLRNALTQMSSNVFRPRPWFEPGVWGGQWIKQNINGLNKAAVNYAWSFELIAPENGVVLENGDNRLEISIDSLLYHNNTAVLGKAAGRFGYHYPIRFDFLDTMDGDNLSVQCHPSVKYTRDNFGEDFTQDETYYILETQPGAEVYLGFQDDIDKDKFRHTLENSFENNEPVDVKKFVQTFPAKKHDLFLIPNGTVHCSGKGNLVLEISATPYIFTFKMYDWLRPDLNGNPRPLNINRAFDNLNFDRKGETVAETLISKQTVIKKAQDWQVVSLPTHPEHFYTIERLEFNHAIADITNNQCLVLSLVEGEKIIVQTRDVEMEIHYAETFIIPAKANTYKMINIGGGTARVIKAYVKDECCSPIN